MTPASSVVSPTPIRPEVAQPRATASPAPSSSLLPGPDPAALQDADPMTMLYLLDSKDRKASDDGSVAKIKGLQTQREHDLAKEQDAIRKQDEAAKNHGFLDQIAGACGEIAKVAGVVGSIAAAAATAGAASPLAAVAIAGAVLSTAGFADGELHVLQKLGIDDKTAGFIDLGLSLGGLASSAGAGLLASAETASSTARGVGYVASGVTGAALVAKGATEIESGQSLADLDRAEADQLAATAHSHALQRAVERIVDEVRDADEQSKQISKTIVATKTTQLDTLEAAASASLKG